MDISRYESALSCANKRGCCHECLGIYQGMNLHLVVPTRGAAVVSV